MRKTAAQATGLVCACERGGRAAGKEGTALRHRHAEGQQAQRRASTGADVAWRATVQELGREKTALLSSRRSAGSADGAGAAAGEERVRSCGQQREKGGGSARRARKEERS